MPAPHAIVSTNDGYHELSIPCRGCGNSSTLTVDEEGYTKWVNGSLIQNALPDLSVEMRETLISSYCTQCQEDIFAEEEDDDYEDDIDDEYEDDDDFEDEDEDEEDDWDDDDWDDDDEDDDDDDDSTIVL